MALANRLKYLEKRLAPPPPLECPACGVPLAGQGPNAPAGVTLSWHEPGEAPPPPCPECGRTSTIWIEFDRAG